MTEAQIVAVQETFALVEPGADLVAGLFYDRLFELDPSLRPLFRGDITEQGRKLMKMLSMVVRELRGLQMLLPAIEQLGERHAGYGVQPEHYATVGQALLETLAIGLGDRFTPAVRDAWTVAYTALATTMQAGAAKSLADSRQAANA